MINVSGWCAQFATQLIQLIRVEMVKTTKNSRKSTIKYQKQLCHLSFAIALFLHWAGAFVLRSSDLMEFDQLFDTTQKFAAVEMFMVNLSRF